MKSDLAFASMNDYDHASRYLTTRIDLAGFGRRPLGDGCRLKFRDWFDSRTLSNAFGDARRYDTIARLADQGD